MNEVFDYRDNLTSWAFLPRLGSVKTLSVGQLKADFSSVVDDLKQGKEVAIIYGRRKVPLATIVPQSKLAKPDYSIKLGDLQTLGWTYEMKDFDMTDEELLGE